MRKKSGRYIFGILIIILGLGAFVIPRWVFPTCIDRGMMLETVKGMKVPMKCFYAMEAEMIPGTIAVLLGLLICYSVSSRERIKLLYVSVIVFAFVVLIPVKIPGVCGSSEMPCNYGTKPALITLGVIGILVSLAAIAVNRFAVSGDQ